MRSNSRIWPVHERYQIQHGLLVAVGNEVRHYDPLAHQEVISEFGKLHEGDQGKLLQFARTWGLLTHGTEEPDVPLEEPLPLIWLHVRNARLVLELHYYLERKDYQGLGQFLDSYRKSCESASELGAMIGPVPLTVPIATDFGPIKEIDIPFPVGDSARVAEEIIEDLVNLGLRGMYHQLHAGPLRLEPYCPSLLVAIYWHLANTVSERRLLRRCQVCSELFVVTDRRQKYCPRPVGWAGETGSLCGARSRKRRKAKAKNGG